MNITTLVYVLKPFKNCPRLVLNIEFRQSLTVGFLDQTIKVSSCGKFQQQVVDHVTLVSGYDLFTKALDNKRATLDLKENLRFMLNRLRSRNLRLFNRHHSRQIKHTAKLARSWFLQSGKKNRPKTSFSNHLPS